MSNPRLIKLSNGVTFKLDAVRLIARKDLNEYIVVLEGTNVQPRATADDVAFIESLFDITQQPEKVPEPAIAIPPLPPMKLAVVD